MVARAPAYDALLAALAAQRQLLGQTMDGPLDQPGPDDVADMLVEAVGTGLDRGVQPDRTALRLAVRHLAAQLEKAAPGRSVEVRVPPYAAVQCLAGPRHTRGNPPRTVEADPVAFVQLCTGRLEWAPALADGRVRASGGRADLSPYLPLR